MGSNYGSFPITSGAFHGGDASLHSPKVLVLKLAPTGQVIYSTSFGGTLTAPTTGSSGGEHDNGVAVAVDDGGNAYVTGYTSAADFPVTAGAYQTSFAAGCPYPAFTIATGTIGTIAEWLVDDVFVVKLSPDGKAALFSTLLGGSCYDHPTSIALDAFGRVYVTGETDSADFPLVSSFEPAPPVRQFASFLSVFNPAGSALMLSSHLYAGAAPSVVAGPGRLTYVAGSSGTGAQTQPDSGFTNPFPLTATDGYLALIRSPEPFPGRLPPPRHRVISHYNQAHFRCPARCVKGSPRPQTLLRLDDSHLVRFNLDLLLLPFSDLDRVRAGV